MIVRSHLPWPLRWAVVALAFGFSAALAMWAFETGKDLAGLDRDQKDELVRLRAEVSQLRAEREHARSIANTAGSLLKAEQTTQEQLATRLRDVEAENLKLKADLGFFERLLPAGDAEGLAVRGFQASVTAPGQVKYQLLVMHNGKTPPAFEGRYELQLTGVTPEGRPWTAPGPTAIPLSVRQYARVEGVVDHAPQAVVKTVQVRVLDAQGAVRATQTVRL